MRLTLALLVFASGCTAARSSYYLINATRELERAREVGAAKAAPYEWTMASEFYVKACEENAYNEFGAADTLAKASMEWSAKAVVATSESTQDFGEEFVPEERKKEEVKEQKENTLDQIDLDEI